MAWETNLVALKGKERYIKDALPFETVIVDNAIYEKVYVEAVISDDSEKLKDGELLFVRDFRENFLTASWRIKIINKLAPPHAEYL